MLQRKYMTAEPKILRIATAAVWKSAAHLDELITESRTGHASRAEEAKLLKKVSLRNLHPAPLIRKLLILIAFNHNVKTLAGIRAGITEPLGKLLKISLRSVTRKAELLGVPVSKTNMCEHITLTLLVIEADDLVSAAVTIGVLQDRIVGLIGTLAVIGGLYLITSKVNTVDKRELGKKQDLRFFLNVLVMASSMIAIVRIVMILGT